MTSEAWAAGSIRTDQTEKQVQQMVSEIIDQLCGGRTLTEWLEGAKR